jgi:uncharacterized membrane protein
MPSRHSLEFPPDEWMAGFGAICVLLFVVMMYRAVRKRLLDRKSRELAERSASWASSKDRKKSIRKKQRR